MDRQSAEFWIMLAPLLPATPRFGAPAVNRRLAHALAVLSYQMTFGDGS